MKKGLLVIALAALLALPLAAVAGMWSITDNEMEDVTGQAGITIDMTMEVTAGYVAYGDDDGSGAYSTGGFFTLSGMTINNGGAGTGMNLSGLTIDVGNNGTDTALIIGLPSISGDIGFSSLKLGTAADTGNSLGSLTIGDLATSASTIYIKAH